LKGEAAECAVVPMVSVTGVTPLPAGIVEEGEKVAVVPIGKPETVSSTGFAVVPFEGVIVRVKFAGLPATTELVGVGALTLKSSTTIVSGEVGPPPGAGLFTTMFSAPLCAKSLEGNVAVSNVELETVVGRRLPPTRTVEPALKFVPVTVKVTAASPAETVVGERLLAPGTGLLTVKVVTRDGLPPGFVTVTKGVPATAMALAGIAACN
jgi:hypothetical protein